jgi:hypothetical protein
MDVTMVDDAAQVLTRSGPQGPGVPARPHAPAPARDAEHGARQALREQVARLERDLADTLIAAFPHDAVDVTVPARGRGPRILGLGDLELLRDDLAEKLRQARVEVERQGLEHAAHRALLEQMLVDPAKHKYARLSLHDLGEPGCGVYQVRPRLGLIGMLAGWWHVKLSSGCPRPTG